MGRIGEQPEGEVLPADRGRQKATASRDREVEQDDGDHRRHFGNPSGGVMTLAARLRSWLRAIGNRSRMEREMDHELRFHIESYVDDLVKQGVPREEAMRRARIEFGGTETHKEECRASLGLRIWDELFADLRYALRMM